MKGHYLRILMGLAVFAGLSITAKAQAVDQIVVTIPFEFVIAGKTLPAGTYRATRLSNDRWEGLILSSSKNRASVMVHPVAVESPPADKAQVSFQTVGDQHFLSKIETGQNVFTIPVPRVVRLEASAAKLPDGNVSGSPSGNK